MAFSTERLIIFTRFPVPGEVKSRLIPALGPNGACQLHQALTRATLDVAKRVQTECSPDLEIQFAGGDSVRLESLYGPDPFHYVPQSGIDLGDRMSNAFASAFHSSFERVVVIGTDCPEINPRIITTAFESLKNYDVVLGPADDGGYYLIGLRAERRGLFFDMPWGSDQVLRQTVQRSRRLGDSVCQLRRLPDVDYPEDLIACRRAGICSPGVLPEITPGLISIVIPTLNEATHLERAIHEVVGRPGVEVIVADGGSTDSTIEIARRLGATVVSARRGRGPQMNSGAAMARGELLLFLHADSQLPAAFPEIVRSTLKPGVIAAAFRLKIDGHGMSLRLVEWGANLRSQYRQIPYGDQGIFIRAADFFEIGGFPNWPLMEDYELCRRLRRRGRIELVSSSITTSARRWQKRGVLMTTLTNQICIAAFHAGIPPDAIAKYLYYRR